MLRLVATKLSWILMGLSLALLLGGALAYADYLDSGDEVDRGAFMGMVFFSGLMGIPAGIYLARDRRRKRQERAAERLRGYVRSRDAIALGDLARALGTTEVDAEAELLSLIEDGSLDLVYHRCREEYLHRNRIRAAHTFIDTCPTCGARQRNQVVLEGEDLLCEYCGVSMVAER